MHRILSSKLWLTVALLHCAEDSKIITKSNDNKF